jgi:hypothetical protein
MGNKILVPLRKRDHIEEIIPYLKEVAQPGTSVIFLIHQPVNGFKWLQAYSAIMQCGLEKAVAVRRMVESYSAETRSQLARQGVFHACEALHEMGLKISVEAYAGSLTKALKNFVPGGDVELIIMRPRFELRTMELFHKTVAFWSAFKRPSVPPVFLGTSLR